MLCLVRFQLRGAVTELLLMSYTNQLSPPSPSRASAPLRRVQSQIRHKRCPLVPSPTNNFTLFKPPERAELSSGEIRNAELPEGSAGTITAPDVKGEVISKGRARSLADAATEHEPLVECYSRHSASIRS